LIDLRSWPKKWNDSGLRQIVTLPEDSHTSPWPLVGMLAFGLVAGAALGGYAVSQRTQMKRLSAYAHRMRDELASMGGLEAVEPVEVLSNRSNHRRKATSAV
jgi:hypothetical protein